MCVIETAKANKYMSSDIAKVGTLLPTSWLREWVNRVIDTLILPLPTLPVPPDGVLKNIQYVIKQLEQACILKANVAKYSPDSSWLNV